MPVSLLTDDDDDLRRFTPQTLIELGYGVIEAGSAAELPTTVSGFIVVHKPAPVEALAEAIERCLAQRDTDVVPLRADAE